MRFLFVLCVMLFSVPALAQPTAANSESPGGRQVVERENQPDIVNYDGADGAMNAAIDEARSRLPYFWERIGNPARGESDFTLKVAFPVTSEEVRKEHIWVEDLERDGETFKAALANEPNWMTGKHVGDAVVFTEDMISDWGFARRGKLIGFYTLRVMLPDMPEDERGAYEAMLGVNPD